MNRNEWKKLRRRWVVKWLPPLLTLYIRLLNRTLRYHMQIPDATQKLFQSKKPVIWAFWHGRILLMPSINKQMYPDIECVWTMISEHWDGELISRIVKPFKIYSVRGSSTRGGQRALLEMIKKGRDNYILGLTPDGPKGPRGRVQPGVLKLAQLTGIPIVAVSWNACPRWRANSWDHFQIPMPFARASAFFSEPMFIPRKVSPEGFTEYCSKLEKTLNLFTQKTNIHVKERRKARWLSRGYNIMLSFFSLVASPLFIWKMFSAYKYRAGFFQRLGFYPKYKTIGNGAERPFWIHAVSVGEVLATVPFVKKLMADRPHLPLIVSTITPTGQKVAQEKFPDIDKVIYFPFDYPLSAHQALKRIDPRLFIHTETEIWPNFLFMLGRKGIPSVIINGRISARSCKQYGWFRFFFKRVLASISVFGMQSKEDCLRIIRIGADPEKVFITGNMKFDIPDTPFSQEKVDLGRREMGFSNQDLIFVAGSTHSGEEEILLEVFLRLKIDVPRLRLLLAPRHPERCNDIEKLIIRKQISLRRRTQIMTDQEHGESDILLLDTIGELAQSYLIGDIVFVGGSLVPVGGHNLLEPIVYKKPVLFGPYTDNTIDIVTELKKVNGGIEVYNEDSLFNEALKLLNDPKYRERMGQAAYGIIEAHRGATERNFGVVQKF